MSYCRWGAGSDVYVIATSAGFTCYCEPFFNCKSELEMIQHLHQHKAAGDEVPADALDRLREEAGDVQLTLDFEDKV